MNIQIVDRAVPQFDEDGLLVDASAWNERLAQDIAHQYDVGLLTDEHWQIIYALRDYHRHFGVAPATHSVCRELGHGDFWVHDLFHSCLNAWRIAGLPNPGEEAKSYLSSS